ncbi:MAG TPA: PilZ domain-containing protein [Polyangiaceae bacterium]|nr:PilZ domain-containing protein [Polyangiaceae bacterium]
MTAERRAHHRLVLTTPAEVIVGGEPYPAALVSLSLGGAALRVDVECQTGQLVEVRLRLPQSGWIGVRAEVVRVAARALGVRFLALDPVSLGALAALLGRT